MTTLRRLTLLGVVIILVMPAMQALASQTGMVLIVEGRMEPTLSQYQALALPASISLSEGSRVQIALFDSCEIVKARGPGTVTLNENGSAAGSAGMRTEKGNCAREIRFEEFEGEAGGTTLRGATRSVAETSLRAIGPRPTIIVDDPDLQDGLMLELTQSSPVKGRFRIPLSAVFLVWPESGPALAIGSTYEVKLYKAGKATGAPQEISVSAKSDDTAPFLIVRHHAGK